MAVATRDSNWPQNFCKAPMGLCCTARVEDTLLFHQENDRTSLKMGMTVGCFSLLLETSLEPVSGTPL